MDPNRFRVANKESSTRTNKPEKSCIAGSEFNSRPLDICSGALKNEFCSFLLKKRNSMADFDQEAGKQNMLIGLEKIREKIPLLDSDRFSKEVFDQCGVFVIRGAIPAETIARWQSAWNRFYAEQLEAERNVNRFNPVSVDETPPAELAAMHQDPDILDVVEQAFGPDIALYNQRFVIKDHRSRGPVFLHSDFPYHRGWPRKASAFVPLSDVSPENGGMYFYPGTNQFGYLGDVGELRPDAVDSDWPVITPVLHPGDFVLMNSCTWHGSGPHVSGPDRILADIIYQPADDPSGISLLRGQWQTELFLSRSTQLFQRSRVTRLKELQTLVDQYVPEELRPR
jgi:hypothetical protein